MNVSLSVVGTYAEHGDVPVRPDALPEDPFGGGRAVHPGGVADRGGASASPTVTTQLKLTAFVFHQDAGGPAPRPGGGVPAAAAACVCPRRPRRPSPARRAGRPRARSPRRRPSTAAARRPSARCSAGEIPWVSRRSTRKQMPQVIGLGVASCGMFGYFAYKMVAPTVSAAPAPPPKAAHGRRRAVAARPTPQRPRPRRPPRRRSPDAQPPTPGMRDPFIATISDQDAAPRPQAPAVAAGAGRPKKTQVARREGADDPSFSVPAGPAPARHGTRKRPRRRRPPAKAARRRPWPGRHRPAARSSPSPRPPRPGP